MASPKSRKGGGGKRAKTETVTVRLDPKLRYLADIAARKQRRTLSSFIEWALEQSLKQVILRENEDGQSESVADLAEILWDVDNGDRFMTLATTFPELLTHDEQILWKGLQSFDADIEKVKREAIEARDRFLAEYEKTIKGSPMFRDHWEDMELAVEHDGSSQS